jgi:excisionase family DNA binding protein
MAGDRARLRTDEVAELLDVSKSTVINYAKDGLLRITRTAGRHRRYDAESVIELKKALEIVDEGAREATLQGIRRRNRGEPEPEPPAG